MTLFQSILTALAAMCLIVIGVGMLVGPAWAFIAAGVLLLVGIVVLYDRPDVKPGPSR